MYQKVIHMLHIVVLLQQRWNSCCRDVSHGLLPSQLSHENLANPLLDWCSHSRLSKHTGYFDLARHWSVKLAFLLVVS